MFAEGRGRFGSGGGRDAEEEQGRRNNRFLPQTADRLKLIIWTRTQREAEEELQKGEKLLTVRRFSSLSLNAS